MGSYEREQEMKQLLRLRRLGGPLEQWVHSYNGHGVHTWFGPHGGAVMVLPKQGVVELRPMTGESVVMKRQSGLGFSVRSVVVMMAEVSMVTPKRNGVRIEDV